jgi:3',5'-cyclic AMP phosphodiesterase CpdA
MRIIHFSDVHAGGWLRDWTGLFDKRLLGTCNHVLRRARHHRWSRLIAAVRQIRLLAPDLVICSGDITSLSEPREFELAMTTLEPLVSDRRFEFLYVPGNHDAYVARPRLQQALRDAFRHLNRRRWTLDQLPQALSVQRWRVLAFNEAVAGRPWGSSGEMSPTAQAWAASELATPLAAPVPARVLVHHYPLRDAQGRRLSWRRGCHGTEDLLAAWDRGEMKFSLCGHIHTPFVRQDAGGGVEICAGSLTHFGVFNLLDYCPADGTFQQRWVPVDEDGPPTLIPVANSLPAEI